MLLQLRGTRQTSSPAAMPAGWLLASVLLVVGDVGDPRASTSCPPRRPSRSARPAPASVDAPRTDELRQRGPHRARRARPPAPPSSSQYDFTIARGASVAAQQLRELERKVAPIDAAFAEGVDATSSAPRSSQRGPGRRARRATTGRRSSALDAERWAGRPRPRPRASSTRSSAPSSATPRSRSSATASRTGSPATSPCAETALGAALIRPLVVAQLLVLPRAHGAGADPRRGGRRGRHQELGARRDDRAQRRPGRRGRLGGRSSASASTRAASTSPG